MSDSDTRGMGQCRLCTQRPSNIDHVGWNETSPKLVVCGAWAHYMFVHRLTLVAHIRKQVMQIDTESFAGNTVAYRSAAGARLGGSTLRVFFFEKGDGVHIVGSSVDVDLFNHLRQLVLRCGGEVPPDLTGDGVVVASTPAVYDELLAQLKQGPSKKQTDEWKIMAGDACRKLKADFKGVDLSDLGPERLSLLNQIVQLAFQAAFVDSTKIRVFGFAGFPQDQEILAEETIGDYHKVAIQIRAFTNGPDVGVYYEHVNEYDSLR